MVELLRNIFWIESDEMTAKEFITGTLTVFCGIIAVMVFGVLIWAMM